MPLDTNLALGFRQPEFENPVNQFGKLLALKHAQSQNAMAEYQLNAARRGDAEADALRAKFAELSALPGGFDPNKPEHVNAIVAVSPDKGAALVKHFGDIAKERALTQKTAIETTKTKQELAAQGMREMVTDPSDENVKRTVARMVEQGVFTQEQAAESEKNLLRMSAPERIKHWQMKGASAKEVQDWTVSKPLLRKDGQKEWYVEGNPNRDDFGKELKALPTVQHVADPNAVLSSETQIKTTGMTNATTRRGQDITAQTAHDKLLAETDPKIQGQLAAAREFGQQASKNQVAAKTALPKVILEANRTAKEIDDLIGSAKIDDKTGKVTWDPKGPQAQPGFSAVGSIMTPVFKWIPGSKTADFQARHDQIMGSAFMKAYETLKGGGQITEVEGEKGTAAITRMKMAQSPAEYVRAARELQQVLKTGIEAAKAQANMDYGSPSVPNAPMAPITSPQFPGFSISPGGGK